MLSNSAEHCSSSTYISLAIVACRMGVTFNALLKRLFSLGQCGCSKPPSKRKMLLVDVWCNLYQNNFNKKLYFAFLTSGWSEIDSVRKLFNDLQSHIL
jgi:hypothetical protein